jgi:hypothetical protein
MRIERDEAGIADLRTFNVPQYLTGKILVGEPAVFESDHLAGDFSPAIARKIKIDRP